MDSKTEKYLDNVIGSLVRGTKIDYDKKAIHFTSLPNVTPLFRFNTFLNNNTLLAHGTFFDSFVKYCRDTFGLTNREMSYVYDEYCKIIKDKIKR